MIALYVVITVAVRVNTWSERVLAIRMRRLALLFERSFETAHVSGRHLPILVLIVILSCETFIFAVIEMICYLILLDLFVVSVLFEEFLLRIFAARILSDILIHKFIISVVIIVLLIFLILVHFDGKTSSCKRSLVLNMWSC